MSPNISRDVSANSATVSSTRQISNLAAFQIPNKTANAPTASIANSTAIKTAIYASLFSTIQTAHMATFCGSIIAASNYPYSATFHTTLTVPY